jgi:hypothetical protein
MISHTHSRDPEDEPGLAVRLRVADHLVDVHGRGAAWVYGQDFGRLTAEHQGLHPDVFGARAPEPGADEAWDGYFRALGPVKQAWYIHDEARMQDLFDAFTAGYAAREQGEPAEWGVRFGPFGVRTEQPAKSEAEARAVTADMRGKYPEWNAKLLRRLPGRPAGDWTVVDGEGAPA